MSTNLQFAYGGNSQYIGRGTYTYIVTRQGLWNFLNDVIVNPPWEVDSIFADPMEYIKAVYFFPIDLYSQINKIGGIIGKQPIEIGTASIKTLKYSDDTTSNSYKINALQYIDVCEYEIERKHNNFMDFSPYTKINLFLPYVGFVDLDVNSVMGRKIYIKYAIDLFSGKCTAYVLTDDDNANRYVVQKFDGVIGVKYDIGNGNFNDVSRNLLKLGVSALGSAGGFLITGGNPVGAMVGSSASQLSLPSPSTPMLEGNVPVDFDGLIPKHSSKYIDISNATNTAVGVLSSSGLHYQRGSCTNDVTNMYDPNSCYLIIESPNVKYPNQYNSLIGKPLYQSKTLSELSGYTVVDEIHLEGFYNATKEEVSSIETILKSGVIL